MGAIHGEGEWAWDRRCDDIHTASISAGCESTGDAATATAAATAAFDEPSATHATAAYGPRDERNAARTTIYA